MSTQSANTATSNTSNNPQFTWIPFYEELAEKLLEFKDKREDLLKIIYELDKKIGTPLKCEEKQLQDIDPFTIFALFNGGQPTMNAWKKRIKIAQQIKEVFHLGKDIPQDFVGIPITRTENHKFYNDKTFETDINMLWELFEDAMTDPIDNQKFSNDFNAVYNIFDVGLTCVTIILFWIQPKRYIPLDKNTRRYLKSEKIALEKNAKKVNGQYYLNFIDTLKDYPQLLGMDFPTISLNAWKFKDKKGENTMNKSENNSEEIPKIVELLRTEKNIILQGAPGTGKTYTTAEIALRVLGFTDDFTEHKAVMTKYKELQDKKQIFFTTFHQSMDYEDFVEGLKPKIQKDDNGKEIGITYKSVDGIFKEACRSAIIADNSDSVLSGINNNPTIWKVSLEGARENLTKQDCFDNGYIRIGWSEYGDIHDFSEFSDFTHGGQRSLCSFQNKIAIGDIVLPCYSEQEIDAIGIVTGNYEYRENGGKFPRYRTVRWLVKNIRENIYNVSHKKLTPPAVHRLDISLSDIINIVKKYSSSQTLQKESPVVLIIDEINRGNVSKIFGELITLIEADKRSGKEHPITVTLPYSKKDFGVPSNLYIIGTMNTTDRTTGTIDYAVRRRFAFVTLKADVNTIKSPLAQSLFKNVHNFIDSYKYPEMDIADLMVGHSYFMTEKDEPDINSAEHVAWEKQLKAKIQYKVIPLLKEYINDGILRRDQKQEEYFKSWLELKPYTEQKKANNSDSSEEGTTNSEGEEN